eukprot:TRINITY_DN110854_c0_g1_i1.p1 TRINITY_DN110854_c0_g1~~TRINITY_DN110854_c0_g1_i1.p1  ORF type:complete len:331 (+),score=59.05 TRINITY_DN110854_c0_g1_i1:77-994(+)
MEDELAAPYLHYSHASLLKFLVMRDRKIAIYELEISTLRNELQRANESLKNELQRAGEREELLKTELRNLEDMIHDDCVFRDQPVVEEEPRRPLSPKEIMQNHVDRVTACWGELSQILNKAAPAKKPLQQALDDLRHANAERRQRLEQAQSAQQAGRESRQAEAQRGDVAPQPLLPSSPVPLPVLPAREPTELKQAGQAQSESNHSTCKARDEDMQDSGKEKMQFGKEARSPPRPPSAVTPPVMSPQESNHFEQASSVPRQGAQVAGQTRAVEVQGSDEEGTHTGQDSILPPFSPSAVTPPAMSQ